MRSMIAILFLVFTVSAGQKFPLVVGGASNYVKIDSVDGIKLYGTATVWDDMDVFVLSAAKNIWQTGAPPLIADGRGFSFPRFGIGDSLEGNIEHTHKFKEGDTAHFHFHWVTNGREVGATFVNWSIHYLVVNTGDTITYTGTITKQDTIAANTPSLSHKYTEIGEVPTALVKVGAYKIIIIKRIAASPATNPAANPFGLAVGIHKKIDMIGSKSETTK